MTAPNGNRSWWWALVVALLVPTVITIAGYGALRTETEHNRDALSSKADREVVAIHNAAILRELQALREDFQALRRELRRQ